MTPPEHLFIGFSLANVFYSLLIMLRKRWYGYLYLLLLFGIVSMAPDIDSFFGNYRSKDPWIGHRGMTHSLIGVAVLGLGLIILFSLFALIGRLIFGYWRYLVHYFTNRTPRERSNFVLWKYLCEPFHPWRFLVLFAGTFIVGYSHLLVDMIQPPSVWGGIPLFFPLKINGEYMRSGGWNLIGWYDLKVFWIIIATFLGTIPFVFLGKLFDFARLKYVAAPLFALVILFNAGVYIWIGNYISSQRYTGNADWYTYQMKIVNTFPSPIKETTLKGKTIFLSLFRQMRRKK
jgi:membrane-bound metal-dependent hydrolase YbcI (DUF457 family)